jgi:hypothetical protein
MMKITGPGRPATPEKSRAPGRAAAGEFRVGEMRPGERGGAAVEARPADMLSALIEIQSAASRDGGRRRSIAAAQRALSLLDRLRLALLDGGATEADLNALALASSVRGDVEIDDPALEAVLDEIALRARVELAKRGR